MSVEYRALSKASRSCVQSMMFSFERIHVSGAAPTAFFLGMRMYIRPVSCLRSLSATWSSTLSPTTRSRFWASARMSRASSRDRLALGEALDELEAGALGPGATPLEVGVPLLGRLVLDDGGVIVLVAVLAVLREAAHVADTGVLEVAIVHRGRAEALEVVGPR